MGRKQTSGGVAGAAPADAAKPFLRAMVSTTCPGCADTFSCGARAASCWCQDLPALDLAALAARPERSAERFAGASKTCLCASCLGAALALVAKP